MIKLKLYKTCTKEQSQSQLMYRGKVTTVRAVCGDNKYNFKINIPIEGIWWMLIGDQSYSLIDILDC